RGWLAVAQFRLSGRPSRSGWIIVTLPFSLPLMSLIRAESRGVRQLQTCAVQQPRILPVHDLSFSKAAGAIEVKASAHRMNRRETARRDFMFILLSSRCSSFARAQAAPQDAACGLVLSLALSDGAASCRTGPQKAFTLPAADPCAHGPACPLAS